jgi:hypothetical protein
MTREEARDCVERIKVGLGQVGALLLALKENQGWKALGYDSWRDCAAAEFGKSQSRIYQLLDAAKVERNFQHAGKINYRAADRLKDLPAGLQQEVYEMAKLASGNGKPTARNITWARNRIRTDAKRFLDSIAVYQTPTEKFKGPAFDKYWADGWKGRENWVWDKFEHEGETVYVTFERSPEDKICPDGPRPMSTL